MGGISANRCLVARTGVVSTNVLFFSLGRAGCSGTLLVRCCWVVFGTLLGPEATGSGLLVPGLCVSGFPGCTGHACCVCGVCGLGLLFENYIVDASILYKKQFPRI